MAKGYFKNPDGSMLEIFDAKAREEVEKLDATVIADKTCLQSGKYIPKNAVTATIANQQFFASDEINVSLCYKVIVKTALVDSAVLCVLNSDRTVSRYFSGTGSLETYDIDLLEGESYVKTSFYAKNASVDDFCITGYISIKDMKEELTAMKSIPVVPSEWSRNLLPISTKQTTVLGVSVLYDDGHMDIIGVSTGGGGRLNKVVDPFTLPSGTYTIAQSGSTLDMVLEDVATNSIVANISKTGDKNTFTLTDAKELYIGVNLVSGVSYNARVNIQLEKGETKSAWQAPSYSSAVDIYARAEVEKVDNSFSAINNMFYAYSMWKILCIGDSLTSGASYKEDWGAQASTGDSIDANYPRILGRMLDAEVTNAGFSGYSATTWNTNKLTSYNYNAYDTFIIWFGTNNGITDGDAEYLAYKNIIDTIKAQNSSCLIILMKVFASKGSVSTTNQMIEKLANTYGCPIVDNSDIGQTAHPELHAGINNPHFGIAGNTFISNRIINTISKWFAENPLRCEYHYTGRTN